MSRIHIGKKGSRMGVWVAADGSDASSETGKFLLNSDCDYLKMHHYAEYTSTGYVDLTPGTYEHDAFEVTFSALTYTPLVVVSVRSITSGHPSAIYPQSSLKIYNPSGSAWDGPSWNIRNDRVAFAAMPVPGHQTLYYRVRVFKNKIADW